ncbi:carboxynorspermidine decarboxylase [Ruminococcaceae bacterium FB2012]|nr:carboxynorspermidine decarboxylase [Ruminococcaceae bacterium FB2012]
MLRTARPVFAEINTPAYVIDEAGLKHNLEILREVMQDTGCKILLAQKAFSMFAVYPMIAEYLCGTTASGLYEAKLGREHFPGEVHVFSPAYKDEEFGEILEVSDHIVFNSAAQLMKFKDRCAGKSIGLRINPECSTQETAIYDPCAVGSRMGVRACDFDESLLQYLDGLHFHTLCEQDSDALEVTLEAVEEKFGKYLFRLKWLNFGGGHHITRPGYDRQRLCRLIKRIREKYGVEIYLEPGEAVALNAGWLVTEVMDIVRNGIDIAVLDASAACHAPDVLEMPYRPPLFLSGKEGEKPCLYRLSSRTCLAGDVFGDYSFDAPLSVGDRLCFEDMAIYSFVKNNTFNGMPLPDIGLLRKDGSYELIRRFGYEDFKQRLS